jgi:pantoate--beta-alanine ligase
MAVELVETISELRGRVADRRSAGALGLVPTMGALHAGHASLIAEARRSCATVVASIFVNPLQFDRADDLASYPRPLEADLDMCADLGVDMVFAPSVPEMYPGPARCAVDVGRLADHLCGSGRPGHFRGVATVVLKLFQIIQPDVAFFGEKDAQQLAIVRRMVADFNVPVRVVGVPTVRETDGLALSSRNRRMTPAERHLAPALYRVLLDVQARVRAGVPDTETIVTRAAAGLPADERLRLEYLALVDPDECQPVDRVTGPVIAAGALWVGSTRLIDNVRCVPQGQV